MYLLQIIRRTFINYRYFAIGLIIGFLYGYFDPFQDCELFGPNLKSDLPTPILDKPLKHPSTTKKSIENKEKLIRPRYYSTELGIREKLFVGVFTSEDKINTQATFINQSITHIVDKVKFFITARSKMKTQFNLSGIVGFTDPRSKYRPFQVIKYIADSFLQTYDYFLLTNDFNYLNARALRDLVNKLSVSKHIYLGTKTEDGSSCNLDAAVLLSNSVVKAMKENLEWCMLNMISDDSSENIGRCIHHSLNLECQESIQEIKLASYKLKHFQLEKHLTKLTNTKEFNNAIIIYPILDSKDYFLLNAYFSRERLVAIKRQIKELEEGLEEWPPGQREGAKPATRFDLPHMQYFNTSHIFFPDDFTNLKLHSKGELEDIENILEETKAYFLYKNPRFKFVKLVNGYKTFDLSRGVDYILDLSFRNLETRTELIRRFQICKPLSRVEFVPVPYVTESSKVTILMCVEEGQEIETIRFLNDYNLLIKNGGDKIFLMLVLLYQSESASKGNEDVFFKVKNEVVKITRHRNDLGIAWVSIRLPKVDKTFRLSESRLYFAVVDLALKKVGVDTLVLLLDVYCNISLEFLNRVRMNTIVNFQVFSVIPFREYDPKVSATSNFDVNKNSGHFDREEYNYISFYGKDYVAARKKSQNIIPIIRIDNDISKLLPIENNMRIFDMFIRYMDHIHCMRATEKDLKVFFHETNERDNLFYGTKVQLAKTLLERNVTKIEL